MDDIRWYLSGSSVIYVIDGWCELVANIDEPCPTDQLGAYCWRAARESLVRRYSIDPEPDFEQKRSYNGKWVYTD